MDSIWNLAKRSKAGKDVGGRAEKIRQAVDGEPKKVKESNETQDYRDKKLREKEEAAGAPKGHKKGGMVGSASKRADGCAVKGKTKGRMV